ncbi:DUF1559 family PulG-like putative transporter [Roseimaritima ulvae]|uniref:DUF1559 domain-containing protein n=1 Tax=Roseimaritima ulvae TaxID=980254 RepID=A0A5B9QST9_9BACT|nr:DUF1559 domain-containing protein [Roseimaritima ulvae]QEG40465.1 hypothetical protein UC8_24770 [Roseimaritima ulvae]
MDTQANDIDVAAQDSPDGINTKVLFALLAFFAVCALFLVWQYNFSDAAIAVSKAEARMECSKRMKAIANAIEAYKDDHGSFPPAFTQSEAGEPLHSWRTLILPYLGEQDLYDRIDLSQSWDSDVNRLARETVVEAYRCPLDGDSRTQTRYYAVLSINGVMKGVDATTPEEVVDGLDSTIAFVEGQSSKAVAWIEPNDLSLSEFLDFDWETEMSHHIGGTHVAMCDGSIMFITDSITQEMLRSLFSASGGEPVDLGW